MKNISLILFLISCTSYSNLSIAVSCGDSVNSDVTLKSDLHCTTGDAALTVTGSNLTINLNGFRISGNATLAGINANDVTNVTIRNGSISDFYAGVNVNNSSGFSINELTFFKTGSGIILHHTNNSNIANNDFILTRSIAVDIRSSADGETSQSNKIDDNEFYKTMGGIQLCGAGTTNTSITNNLILKSLDYSINLANSSNNEIINNEILESTLTALRLNYSSENSIQYNYLKDGSIGIALQASGGISGCDMTNAVSSIKNEFSKNSIFNFDTGMYFGIGSGKNPTVYFNSMYLDKIYDNLLGVRFVEDAWNNDLSNAVFSRNTTDVIDNGTANAY